MDITVTVGRIVRVYRDLTQSQVNLIITDASKIVEAMGNRVAVRIEIS